MKRQDKLMKLIFFVCLLMSAFTSVARADESQTASSAQVDEMTREEQEILASLNDEFSVTLKPNRK